MGGCRTAHQWDKKHLAAAAAAAGGGSSSRSKHAVSSPASSRSGYQLAPTATTDDAGPDVISLVDARYPGAADSDGRAVLETSYILDERPPVEGRDSVGGKDKLCDGDDRRDDVQSASYVPPPRSNVATVRQLQRTDVDPLPLLHGSQQPGGTELDSPGSSPAFTRTPLFADDRAESPLSDVVAADDDDDFEYDDYVPQLPGSYFTMDPEAYTLTWSKQPRSSAAAPLRQPTDADRSNATSGQC